MRESGNGCAVAGCTNKYGRLQLWNKSYCEEHKDQLHMDCPCLRPYSLHRFPSDIKLKLEWMSKIKRDGFIPTRNSRVCSMHFLDGRPTRENPTPQLLLSYESNVKKGRRKIQKLSHWTPKRIKKSHTAQPVNCLDVGPQVSSTEIVASTDDASMIQQVPETSEFSSTCSEVTETEIELLRCCTCCVSCKVVKNKLLAKTECKDVGSTAPSSFSLTSVRSEVDENCIEDTRIEAVSQKSEIIWSINIDSSNDGSSIDETLNFAYDGASNTVDGGDTLQTQFSTSGAITDNNINLNGECSLSNDHNYAKIDTKFECKTENRIKLCAEKLTNEDCTSYTGLSLEIFLTVAKSISEILSQKLTFQMDYKNQVLLFLMRLRLGLLFTDLGRKFDVESSTAFKIFHTVLPIAAKVLYKFIVWLPKEVLKCMSDTLKQTYLDTTCIIDCAVMCIPSGLRSRSQTFSQYKNHETVKLLVAVAPYGQHMFVSTTYKGRASNKTIEKEICIRTGMEVMANCGFTIAEDLHVMPEFTKELAQIIVVSHYNISCL